jgi:hypothetical protein
MRYFEITYRPKHRLQPTEMRWTTRNCNTMQGKFGQMAAVYGCLATLAKAKPHSAATTSHHAPVLALVAMVVCGSAHAQFPYDYAPYTPRYPPNGGQRRSSAQMAQKCWRRIMRSAPG